MSFNLYSCLKNPKLVTHTTLSSLPKIREHCYASRHVGFLRACNDDCDWGSTVSLTNPICVLTEFCLYLTNPIGHIIAHGSLLTGIYLKRRLTWSRLSREHSA